MLDIVNKNSTYATSINGEFPKSIIILLIAMIIAIVFVIISIVAYAKAKHRTNKNKEDGNVGLTIKSIISIIMILTNILLCYFMPNLFDTTWKLLDMATETANNIAIIILIIQIFTF